MIPPGSGLGNAKVYIPGSTNIVGTESIYATYMNNNDPRRLAEAPGIQSAITLAQRDPGQVTMMDSVDDIMLLTGSDDNYYRPVMFSGDPNHDLYITVPGAPVGIGSDYN